MLRFAWLVVFALLASAAGPWASAAPQASIKPTLPESAWASHSTACDGFAMDELTLSVSEHNQHVANKVFCAAYGRAKANVITDKVGQTFILLEYGKGHGSHATTFYLELDRLHPDLLEVLRVPLSWPINPSQMFTYSYVTELPSSGGIRFHLKGRVEGKPFPGLPTCCVPHARNLTIDVGKP
jgi:hypothetical protein